jgi:uncharacterized membrane protein
MSERTLRLATGALAAFGAAIAVYLLYVRESGEALICATGGCETVQSSSYAEVLGTPVAALGLAGFVGLFLTAVLRGEWARIAQATLGFTAFMFSAYLLYIQLSVIGAICQWCVVTDVLTTAIAALALLRLQIETEPAPSAVSPARPYPKPRPNRSRPRSKTNQRARRSPAGLDHESVVRRDRLVPLGRLRPGNEDRNGRPEDEALADASEDEAPDRAEPAGPDDDEVVASGFRLPNDLVERGAVGDLHLRLDSPLAQELMGARDVLVGVRSHHPVAARLARSCIVLRDHAEDRHLAASLGGQLGGLFERLPRVFESIVGQQDLHVHLLSPCRSRRCQPHGFTRGRHRGCD